MGLLDTFTPEQIEALRAELASVQAQDGTRSPYRNRQLDNLELKPTADDPRPTFFWSAEPPRSRKVERPPFRQLLWHGESGREITVKSEEELQRKIREGYELRPRTAVVYTAGERAEMLFNALSEDDKQMVLEQRRQSRIAKAHEALAALNDEDAATIVATPKKAKKV